MPLLNFKVRETFNDVDVTEAYNSSSGAKIDVSEMPVDDLVQKLDSGELYIKTIDFEPSSVEVEEFESAEDDEVTFGDEIPDKE